MYLRYKNIVNLSIKKIFRSIGFRETIIKQKIQLHQRFIKYNNRRF